MNRNLKIIFIFLGFAIPYLLIFKVFFKDGSLAFGDAPFFTPENLKELFNFPFIWNFRHNNFGTSQYPILWLYLPTYVYGFLNHFLNLGNDFLIRAVFYFPATILAIVGAWKFIGKFNQNIYGKFIGSFLYAFNTYFLMLIDGGQVGVVLAYGIFPFTSLNLLNYLEEINLKKYLFSLISIFVLLNVDLRIGLIAILLSFFLWLIVTGTRKWIRLLFKLFLMGLSILGLSLFWVLPTLLNFSSNNFISVGINDNFINLTNSFFLFQSHFPLNQFGKLSPTPFYFCFLLMIILGNLFFLPKFKKIESKLILNFSLLFLLFVFISKGGSNPLGEIYIWAINNMIGGVAFRDASKFYIPLILISGVLLSFTISSFEKIFKNTILLIGIIILIYGYLLLLIYPAILGNLSGVLSQLNQTKENDYQQIFNKLNQEQTFFRSLYIEEKPAKFYGTFEKPVISANTLYKERPFASMIVGKYDLYNFFHNQQLKQWFNLLGIKYVFFPENERKKILTTKEKIERQKFLSFVDEKISFNKINWQLSFPGYINNESMPHIFAQKKAFFIIGGEDIYNLFLKIPNFKLQNQGFIFLEDGKTEPSNLQKIDPEDMLLIFFNKNNNDLLMSFFQKEMISINKALENQWKFRSSEEYLAWKYDLLVNEIESYEFDYGKGVAFSTVTNEKIKFNLNVPQSDNYYLTIRYTNATLSAGIKVFLADKEYDLLNKVPQKFKWNILGPLNLKKGELSLEIINKGGFVMVNTLGIISESNFLEKKQTINNLINKIKVIYLKEDKDMSEMTPYLQENYLPVDYKQIDPTKYSIRNLSKNIKWLVFSDHYDREWQINNDLNFPFYSMINGFYMKNTPSNFDLNFSPQKDVKTGIILSLITIVFIVGGIIYIKWRKK